MFACHLQNAYMAMIALADEFWKTDVTRMDTWRPRQESNL